MYIYMCTAIQTKFDYNYTNMTTKLTNKSSGKASNLESKKETTAILKIYDPIGPT